MSLFQIIATWLLVVQVLGNSKSWLGSGSSWTWEGPPRQPLGRCGHLHFGGSGSQLLGLTENAREHQVQCASSLPGLCGGMCEDRHCLNRPPSVHSPRNKGVVGAGQLARGRWDRLALRESHLRTEILREAAWQGRDPQLPSRAIMGKLMGLAPAGGRPGIF